MKGFDKDMTKETPANIGQLVKDANNKSSWKIRLAALNELKQYDCQQSKDVITRLALHDKVYKVKEEAFRAAQAMGITYRGNPIRLGRKDIGFKTKDWCCIIKVDTLFSRILIYNHNQYENRRKTYGTESKIL